jgi:hypothetical protein
VRGTGELPRLQRSTRLDFKSIFPRQFNALAAGITSRHIPQADQRGTQTQQHVQKHSNMSRNKTRQLLPHQIGNILDALTTTLRRQPWPQSQVSSQRTTEKASRIIVTTFLKYMKKIFETEQHIVGSLR